MAADTNAVAHNVIESLSVLITHAMSSKTYRSWNPSGNVDNDEERMRRYAQRVEVLRAIRNQLEDLMFGEIDD